ncbi:MAG TPA: hypothetical protein VK545_21075 [Streptomyces sp.]|nr:hypothetical protein [Streptomyces sp.]
MTIRGTAGRRVPGNPLAGVLRDPNRRTRTTTRRTNSRGGGEPPTRSPGPAAPPRPPARAAAVVETGEDGRARWEYPRPFGAPPVLTALPAGTGPAVAVLEAATAAYAVVRVWEPDGSPAGAGVRVHLTATSASG